MEFEEVVIIEIQSQGGKGGGGCFFIVMVIIYSYFVNFVVVFCEGEIVCLGWVWVDGKLLDICQIMMWVYCGILDQMVDLLIVVV